MWLLTKTAGERSRKRRRSALTMTVSTAALAALPLLSHVAPRAVIAIPAHDEAKRLPDCLMALAAQRVPGGLADLRVLVLANNCSDATAALARDMAPRLPFPLIVVERWLPLHLANAGGARHVAMAEAVALAGPNTALLSTDADARPDPGWVAANLAALMAGADAVAGTILLDASEAARLPAPLRRRERLESRYAGLLDRLAALVDPVPHDPWPTHGIHSGASIALHLAAYRSVGGIPTVSVGEDRALFAALARRDARIRHCPHTKVTVSCRLEGRAVGGMADTMRRRLDDPGHPVDARLEPVSPALIRLRSRRALRRLREAGPEMEASERLTLGLGLTPALVAGLTAAPSFGMAWEALQAAAPLLRQPWPMRSADLPIEIDRAKAVLRDLGGVRPVAAARPGDIVQPVPAGLPRESLALRR